MSSLLEGSLLSPLLLLFACYFFSGAAFQCAHNPARNKLYFKLYGAKASSRAKTLPKSERQTKNALESCIEISLEAEKEVILVVDANNVRGKEDFKMTNRDLLVKLKAWRSNFYPKLNIVCSIDHGSIPALFSYDGLGLVEFAGPNRTADDVIAQSARWFSNASMADPYNKVEEKNRDVDIFVVTSDGGLRTRCLRANRPGNFKKKRKVKENVKVFASPQLLKSFEQVKEPTIDKEMETSNTLQSLFEEAVFELESDLRMYERLQPPWPNRQAKEDALAAGPWKSAILSSSSDRNAEGTTFECSKTRFDEKTWYRIVVAENMRRMIQQLAHSSSWSTSKFSVLLSRYQQLHEASLSKRHLEQCTMVFDRRIRFETSLQHALVRYLEAGIAATSKDAISSAPLETPIEAAASLLKEMVVEAPERSQDQILLRYINEAPRRLQFPSKPDLKHLLKFIAVREKREGSTRKQWYLLPDHTSLDSWPVSPGESRQRQRKRTERQSPPLDDALLARGAEVEERWFEIVKWPRKFEEVLSSKL